MICLSDYVGLPYRKGARGPDAYDCWGLVMHFYAHELGLVLPDFSYTPDRAGYMGAVERGLEIFKKVDAPSMYDIVLLKIVGRPYHTGLYVKEKTGDRILHAYRERDGSVLDRLSQWQNQIEGYYSWAK